jgi:predicted transcriptional regulator of viral defense system
MRVTDAYSDLLTAGRPVITSGEAADAWGVGDRAAAHRLRVLAEAGIVRRLRRGLWAVDPDIAPFAIAPYLTAPYPAYVSLWSALHEHGMIEQIPREISIVSPDRARRIETEMGTFEVHRIAPQLFAGFEGSPEKGYLALPDKALFDLVYVRAAAGRRAYFPELYLPDDFHRERLGEWTERISSARLRTIVGRRLREAMRQTAGNV